MIPVWALSVKKWFRASWSLDVSTHTHTQTHKHTLIHTNKERKFQCERMFLKYLNLCRDCRKVQTCKKRSCLDILNSSNSSLSLSRAPQSAADAAKLNRKESYKAQRKNYRREKKRVASELMNSLQDPAVIVLADWLKVSLFYCLYCILTLTTRFFLVSGRCAAHSSPGRSCGACWSRAYCSSTRAKRQKAAIGWAQLCWPLVRSLSDPAKRMVSALNSFIPWSSPFGHHEDQTRRQSVSEQIEHLRH